MRLVIEASPETAQALAAEVVPDLPQTMKVDGTPRPGPAETANPNVKRDHKGRLLPGQSLNPGGRKAGLKQIMDEVVDFRKVLTVVASIVCGPLATTARPADRLKAAELLLAYKYGKPHQTLDVNEGKPSVGNVKTMTSERLNQLRATLRPLISDVTDADIVDGAAHEPT